MKKTAGFTTLELSIALIVFSLLVTTFLLGYKTYTMQGAHERTVEKIETVQSAIRDYKSRYGFYPCPADPAIARGQPNYGRSDCSVTSHNGGRDVRQNDDRFDQVLVGAVPFATIADPDNDPETADITVSMGEDSSLDSWGRKMTYAVSENLTTADTFNNSFGVIEVVDENRNSIPPEESSAHFVVVSHGENGRGAFMPNGQRVSTCPTSLGLPGPGQVATPANETENCDPDATFLSGLINESDHSYQDDIARVSYDQDGHLWEEIGTTGNIRNTNPGNVGIGIQDPQERLEIDGDITAAKIDAGVYCDSQGKNCMPADFVGGPATTEGLYANQSKTYSNTCANPGEVAVGIENNRVICEPAFTATGNCPPGEVMIGIGTAGVICCPRNYPVAGHPNPHCRLDGCTASAETRSLTCPEGQTGSIAQRRTRTCPEGTWSEWVTTSNTCAAPDPCATGRCIWRPQGLCPPRPDGQPGGWSGYSCPTFGEINEFCTACNESPGYVTCVCER